MFQFGRYVPKRKDGSNQPNNRETTSNNTDKADDDSTKAQAHTTERHENDARKSSLRVIAPEVKVVDGSRSRKSMLHNDAYDDHDEMAVDELLGDTTTVVASIANADTAEASTRQEIKSALRMSSLPIEEAAKIWRLAPFLVDNLKRDGCQQFFPIQALSIPDVIASERHAHIRARDVCITAPTGSGKTLSFVLPILNSLSRRQTRRLRALVILPNRDLANQVYQVFQSYVVGSDLKVGLSIGQSDFKAEQMALTMDVSDVQLRFAFDPGNLDLALQAFADGSSESLKQSISRSGISAIDILVCTPGRLVDHLDNTPGFSLSHLRFLVVDEADRLLGQTYHNWIDRVLQSANSASIAAYQDLERSNNCFPDFALAPDGCSFVIEPITWRRGGVKGDVSEFNTNDTFLNTASAVCHPAQLRKFLVSATLTKDPQKLASLRLINPKHFDAHQLTETGAILNSNKYAMPEGLLEYTVECTAEQKPMVLMSLLLERLAMESSVPGQKNVIIVFTSSLDSTHRLVRLLQLLWLASGIGEPERVSEFSSSLGQKDRSQVVRQCNDARDNMSIVVCSDGMSRGLDIQFVNTVVNYDVPHFAKTYVHRCGRTSRAGKKGTAISLLKGGQVGQFKKMRGLIHAPQSVKPMGVQKALVRDVAPHYRNCIRALKDVLEAEDNNELKHNDLADLDEFLISK
jgi:ATP-dependent RNA helicase DDX51/DBP6